MVTQTLTVTGMSCTGCEANVEEALRSVDGVENAEADHEADTVTVETDGDVSGDALAAAVEDAGYEPA